MEVKFQRVLELVQPALPMRGVTGQRLRALHHATISTRTPHAGSDEKEVSQDAASDISTRTPHAGSDLPVIGRSGDRLISTRTPHAGSDTAQLLGGDGRLVISTRTPHAGSDRDLGLRRYYGSISTRTPHAGSDTRYRPAGIIGAFQPALPMRGVTPADM